MSDAAHWNYGDSPRGQPSQMQDGEFSPAAARPRLFGQGYRDLAGVPKVMVIPNPRPGFDWSFSPSGPSWFLLRTAVATMTASAAVVTRTAQLIIKYTGVLCAGFGPVINQTAGQQFIYNVQSSVTTTTNGQFVPIPIQESLILKDGMSIGTSTVNLDAADQWSAIALYLEEFTDRCLDVY